jgi:hypothetical protein
MTLDLSGNGPLTGRLNMVGSPLPTPQVFDSGWQGQLAPAAATPAGHGGTVARRVLGLDQSAEKKVASQIIDAPQSDERNLLFAEWESVNRRVREFLTGLHNKQIAELRSELEEVLVRGREALDEWKMCIAEANAARADVNNHLESLSRARVLLKTTRAERPNEEEWPRKDELDEHKEREARADAKADRAAHRHSELQEKLDTAQARARTARTKLQELRAQREQLKAQIEGRPYKGPYGLVTPGSGI